MFATGSLHRSSVELPVVQQQGVLSGLAWHGAAALSL
jgi:hypothetical protein